MPIKYTRQETIARIEEAVLLGMDTFYRSKCVNNSSTTYKSDGNEYYTEITAEWLLSNMDYLNNTHIPVIARDNYKIDGHDGNAPSDSSNRIEERIAMDIWKNRAIPTLGDILDYQTPLKSKQMDNAGKIDLLSYNTQDGILRMLELKKPNSPETLLRCVLEGYTYYLTAHKANLLNSFGIHECSDIRVCPLFFKNSNQYREYQDMLLGHRPFLKKLMKLLNIELVLLEENSSVTFSGFKKYSAKILYY